MRKTTSLTEVLVFCSYAREEGSCVKEPRGKETLYLKSVQDLKGVTGARDLTP